MEELRGRLDELPAAVRHDPRAGGFLGWRRGAAENGWHVE
jgi:hypothetical protein